MSCSSVAVGGKRATKCRDIILLVFCWHHSLAASELSSNIYAQMNVLLLVMFGGKSGLLQLATMDS